MREFIMIRERWGHMTAVSGFDPLCDAIGAISGECNIRARSLHINYNSLLRRPLHQRILSRIWLKKKVVTPVVASSPFVTLLHEQISDMVLSELAESKAALALLSAAENQYGALYAAAPARLRKQLVLCLHQPPSWYRLHWRDPSVFEGVGAVICLGDEQSSYMRNLTSSPVITIRHGAVLDFFRPAAAPQARPQPRLLFVGQWLRDFETLEKAFTIIQRHVPDVQLDCVVPRQARHSPHLLSLARHANVHWHAELSAHALLCLYQQATLLFLPLIDATANNAIVEAMACGLPIISTAVGGIADYVPRPAGELCDPDDPHAHADAVLRWLANPSRCAEARRQARATAERHLNWHTIATGLIEKLIQADVLS